MFSHHIVAAPFAGAGVAPSFDIIARDPSYWHNKVRLIGRLPYFGIIPAEKKPRAIPVAITELGRGSDDKLHV